MANSVKTSSSLKLVYTLGMEGEKVITQSRTISSIDMNATDDNVLGFAQAILDLQQKSAAVSRVDAEALSA
ncbi:MAG: DUF1659 domain-containing protein [Proteocatella sp.]